MYLKLLGIQIPAVIGVIVISGNMGLGTEIRILADMGMGLWASENGILARTSCPVGMCLASLTLAKFPLRWS